MQRFAVAIAAAKEREAERLRRVEKARLAELAAWEDLKMSSVSEGKLCFKLDRTGGSTRVMSMLRGIVRVKSMCPMYDVLWLGGNASSGDIGSLRGPQRINRVYMMAKTCEKTTLNLLLNRQQRLFQDDYSFVPKSWMLPKEHSQFLEALGQGGRTFIMKPTGGLQGKGIYLVQRLADLHRSLRHHGTTACEPTLVQEYIPNPLTIDGRKFDLRLYVVVYSIGPGNPVAFLYSEGMVRICVEKYEAPTRSNIWCSHVHLTNYSLNKDHKDFVSVADEDGAGGMKRSLSSFLRALRVELGDARVDLLWEELEEMCAKTVIAMVPPLRSHKRQARGLKPKERFESDPHAKQRVFQILGVDVLLDSNLKPWLVEVNAKPSLSITHPGNDGVDRIAPVDEAIKRPLLQAVTDLIHDSWSHETCFERAARLGMGADGEPNKSSEMKEVDDTATASTPPRAPLRLGRRPRAASKRSKSKRSGGGSEGNDDGAAEEPQREVYGCTALGGVPCPDVLHQILPRTTPVESIGAGDGDIFAISSSIAKTPSKVDPRSPGGDVDLSRFALTTPNAQYGGTGGATQRAVVSVDEDRLFILVKLQNIFERFCDSSAFSDSHTSVF